MVGQGNIWSQ
jgi:hypothetical protein